MKNLKDEAYKIRLTPEEKQAIRRAIFPVAAPSPYFIFNFQFTRIVSFAAVLILLGGGTAAAAEGALPGDTLYPVKIYVNESVALSFATSPAKRAEAHASLAERRIEEAQALAAEGRLDAHTTETLAASVEVHAEAAEVAADEAEGLAAGAGREVKTKLAAALDTKARVLARLGEGQGEDTEANSGTLAVRVIARSAGSEQAPAKMSVVADAHIEALSVGAPTQNSEGAVGQAAAASLEHDAAEALETTRKKFAAAKDSLTEATIVEIEKELSAIETSMSMGSASLGAGATEHAIGDFTAALTGATKLKALLDAHKKFDGDLIAPLLRGEDIHDHSGEEHSEDEGVKIDIGTDADIQILNAQ